MYFNILYSYFQTNCTLTLFNISNENVIISASVPQREQEALREAGEALLDREKVILPGTGATTDLNYTNFEKSSMTFDLGVKQKAKAKGTRQKRI